MDGYAVSEISFYGAYPVTMVQDSHAKALWDLFQEFRNRRIRALYARLEPWGA